MNPPLPMGYYGNGIVFPAAVTTAEKLSENPLHYAVDLVRKAKKKATDEFVRSVVDQMVMRERADFMNERIYVVSDLTRAGFEQIDIGWGKAVYGGVAKGVADWVPERVTWYIPFKNNKGEEGIMVPVCLPLNAMEVFVKQLQKMMAAARTTSEFNISAL